ncbi:NUDIX hydrolase [Candidatus Marsarchaeota archaeon]|nr:NUDIX hydrolase [Candidatus Marsarchaeota archaeon]MCL5099585.1 NUDIX hydrolase [Candidatus Marsarchaeota archaeon]
MRSSRRTGKRDPFDPSMFPHGVEATGSAIIENEHREILLVRDAKWKNKWVMPGGHIEPGETIMDAMAREGKEEQKWISNQLP